MQIYQCCIYLHNKLLNIQGEIPFFILCQPPGPVDGEHFRKIIIAVNIHNFDSWQQQCDSQKKYCDRMGGETWKVDTSNKLLFYSPLLSQLFLFLSARRRNECPLGTSTQPVLISALEIYIKHIQQGSRASSSVLPHLGGEDWRT